MPDTLDPARGVPAGRRVRLPGRGTTFVRDVAGPIGAPTVVLLARPRCHGLDQLAGRVRCPLVAVPGRRPRPSRPRARRPVTVAVPARGLRRRRGATGRRPRHRSRHRRRLLDGRTGGAARSPPSPVARRRPGVVRDQRTVRRGTPRQLPVRGGHGGIVATDATSRPPPARPDGHAVRGPRLGHVPGVRRRGPRPRPGGPHRSRARPGQLRRPPVAGRAPVPDRQHRHDPRRPGPAVTAARTGPRHPSQRVLRPRRPPRRGARPTAVPPRAQRRVPVRRRLPRDMRATG